MMGSFSTRLKRLMKRAGLSKKRLAEKTELSLSSIDNLTRGKFEPRFSTLHLLRDALGCTWDELMGTKEGEEA